jgi:hypothetical protein
MNITKGQRNAKNTAQQENREESMDTAGYNFIPAFTLWGFGSSSRDREMNKRRVDIREERIHSGFPECLSAAKTAAIMRFGDEFPKVEKYLNLESQAWER